MHIGEASDACNWIQFGRDYKDYKYEEYQIIMMQTGSDCEVKRAGKTR